MAIFGNFLLSTAIERKVDRKLSITNLEQVYWCNKMKTLFCFPPTVQYKLIKLNTTKHNEFPLSAQRCHSMCAKEGLVLTPVDSPSVLRSFITLPDYDANSVLMTDGKAIFKNGNVSSFTQLRVVSRFCSLRSHTGCFRITTPHDGSTAVVIYYGLFYTRPYISGGNVCACRERGEKSVELFSWGLAMFAFY